MAHIGVICPTGSNLVHAFSLGHELQRLGHRITFLNIVDVKDKILNNGFGFRVIGEQERPLGANAWIWETRGKLKGLDVLKFSLKIALEDLQVLLRDAPEAIRSEGIEALIVNQSSPGGGTLADHLDIPYVSVCNALPLNQEVGVPPVFTHWQYSTSWYARRRNQVGHALAQWLTRPINGLIDEVRSQWGLPAYRSWNDHFSSLAQISQEPPELEFPRRELPNHFHFTGPYLERSEESSAHSFPWDQLTGQPLIYASMGTIQNQIPEAFETIANACAGLDGQLVVSLGGGLSAGFASELPGRPILVDYAPQLEILKRASLTITHAGMNTTLESLAYGVPLVAIPVANDQPGVAARIEWSGVGQRIPFQKLNAERLREAVRTVLDGDTYRNRARAMQAAIQRCGGVNEAARIIETAITTRQPVVRR